MKEGSRTRAMLLSSSTSFSNVHHRLLRRPVETPQETFSNSSRHLLEEERKIKKRLPLSRLILADIQCEKSWVFVTGRDL